MSEQREAGFFKDFFDTLRGDEEIQKMVMGTMIVLIPKDNPRISRSVVELASTLPLGMVTFIETSKMKVLKNMIRS